MGMKWNFLGFHKISREGDMYNIAITKENKTSFFNGADDKPRPYPTLADALVSAQYLGLTREDVELHFVREGASIDSITKTTTSMAKPKSGGAAGGKPPATGAASPDAAESVQGANSPEGGAEQS
jgi:hypothetical protein